VFMQTGTTMLLVSHDLEEAVFVGHRVVIMTSRPCRPKKILDVDIAHPRDISSLEYLALRDGILEAIGLAHKV